MTTLFTFADFWWFYGLFIAFVLGMLALDLGVFHRKAHIVRFKEAALWSVFWVSLALLFNTGLYFYSQHLFSTDPRFAAFPGLNPQAEAWRLAMEFLTGFVVEKALAVDNIFVFVLVFSSFGIPQAYQHRVLFFGIVGAIVFRAIFIALSAQLMAYQWVAIVFGAFLVITGIRMLFIQHGPSDPEKSIVINLLHKFMPITSKLEGQKFIIKKGHMFYGTPLLAALVFLEVSDIIFAVDSVPAIFAITKEPFIVFTSNILAILGLRSLYFLLAGVIDRFIYLKYGLALVLVFVGLKMSWLNDAFGGKFPIGVSLAIISSLLIGSVAISLIVGARRASHPSPAHE